MALRGKVQVIDRQFALDFEGRLLKFVKTDPAVQNALENLRGVNVACGFICNHCEQSPECGSIIAYQCTVCDEFDLCQKYILRNWRQFLLLNDQRRCKESVTVFSGGHDVLHRLTDVDIRFPQVFLFWLSNDEFLQR